MHPLNTSQQQQVQGGFLPVAGLGALTIINTIILQMTSATVAAGAVGYVTYKSLSFIDAVTN